MNWLTERDSGDDDSVQSSHVTDRDAIGQLVERAIAEDLPDITTEAIFSPEERGRARFVVKQDGILAGLAYAREVFAQLDPESRFETLRNDCVPVRNGDVVASIEASVRALLSGERTALNLLQRASGIATITRRYVDAVQGTGAGIYDTRKTAPGLRSLDKYAVAAGGGNNHRQGLYDMFLIKNNHIDRAGSLESTMEKVRGSGLTAPIMVEARSLEELDRSIAAAPDFILLDNMPLDQMREAVRRTAGRIPLEASGGVTLKNVRAIAQTGVDRISVGAITHSVHVLDISMRIET